MVRYFLFQASAGKKHLLLKRDSSPTTIALIMRWTNGLHPHSRRQRGPLSEEKEVHHLASSENKVGGVVGLPVPKEIIFELWKTGQSLFWAGELCGLCGLVSGLDGICYLLLDRHRTCAANIFPCAGFFEKGEGSSFHLSPSSPLPCLEKAFMFVIKMSLS